MPEHFQIANIPSKIPSKAAKKLKDKNLVFTIAINIEFGKKKAFD